MATGEPYQLQDNYRLSIPFIPTDPIAGNNFEQVARVVNSLPVDTSMLWLGGSIAPVAVPNLTWGSTNYDGVVYANDGFVVDPSNNLIYAKRAGWFEVFWGALYATGSPLNSSRVHITNNQTSSPYPSPFMDFFAASSTSGRVAGSTLCPMGAGDTLEIQCFQQSGAPLNCKMENLFVRWSRPYHV